MTETVKAWQCIGCGNLEAPQPCIGMCQYRSGACEPALHRFQAEAREARAGLAAGTRS